MRSPVYRNLDKPFQIFGFTPTELIVLALTFVGGGELAQAFGIHRLWAFLLTFILGFALHCFRRALGDLFAPRLFRFLKLPTTISAKIFADGGR